MMISSSKLAVFGISLFFLFLLGVGYFWLNPPNSVTPPPGPPSPSPGAARPCLTGSKNMGIRDPNGPSYHHVYLARSADGINWQTEGKMIIEQGSVPEIVRFPDGRLIIYAVDGSGEGGVGQVFAESKDGGKTWECGKVQAGGADPDGVFLPDGKMRLYSIEFSGGPGTLPDPSRSNAPNKVISHLSSDGRNFTLEDGTRLEGSNYTDPDVIQVGKDWFMYISTGPTAWAAKSTDGLAFTLLGAVNQTGAVSGSYVFPDGTIRHYFCGREGIEIATSADGGSAWQKVDVAIAIDPATQKIICDPSVISDGAGGYLMAYKVQPK